MKSKKPLVSVITVNYNGGKIIEDCLASIFNLDYPVNKLEVIVVDNGSTDNSLNLIRDKFPQVLVLLNEVNNYCKANNLGIKKASGEYVVLINNDVVLDKNWLKEILPFLIGEGNVIGASGKILFPNGRIQSTGHYTLPNFYWSDRGFREKDVGQYEKVEEIESVPNTCVIYKKWIFEKVGFFDEDFHMYLEDIDFCYRCRKQGYKILYIPKAICFHKFHGSAKDDFVADQVERNRLLFIAKHFPDKLSQNLLGFGLSTLENSKTDSLKIAKYLPFVVGKLLSVHKPEVIKRVMPSILKCIREIINYEKYHLAQQNYNLEKELEKFSQEISRKDSELNKLKGDFESKSKEVLELSRELERLNQKLKTLLEELDNRKEEVGIKEEQIKTKEKEILGLKSELSVFKEMVDKERQRLQCLSQEIGQLQENVQKKSEEIKERDEKILEKEKMISQLSSELEEKNKKLEQKEKQLLDSLKRIQMLETEIENLKTELKTLKEAQEAFYSSQTFRFVVKPLWKFLDFVKKISGTTKIKIALIKPYIVSKEDIYLFIEKIRNKYPEADITLIASINAVEKESYINVSGISKRLLFIRDKKINILVSIVRFLFLSLFNKFNEVYVLIGPIIPGGYRKARVLASLLSAQNVKIYYCYYNKEEDQPHIFKLLLRFIFARIGLYLIVLFFMLFVSGRTRLKKLFLRIFKKKL